MSDYPINRGAGRSPLSRPNGPSAELWNYFLLVSSWMHLRVSSGRRHRSKDGFPKTPTIRSLAFSPLRTNAFKESLLRTKVCLTREVCLSTGVENIKNKPGTYMKFRQIVGGTAARQLDFICSPYRSRHCGSSCRTAGGYRYRNTSIVFVRVLAWRSRFGQCSVPLHLRSQCILPFTSSSLTYILENDSLGIPNRGFRLTFYRDGRLGFQLVGRRGGGEEEEEEEVVVVMVKEEEMEELEEEKEVEEQKEEEE
ncbi:unnamed protein product [Nesidiocoris tenuis]|uniref:Uncharacterized protein n=1 Tax=Nesidiocoris tenuis TaxID=355587 RepID=A0A6H5G4S3_9HEMI|nr:unnamed protein product [Nesidiocoris tenuis]